MCVDTKEKNNYICNVYPTLTLLCQQIHARAQILDPFQPMGKNNLRNRCEFRRQRAQYNLSRQSHLHERNQDEDKDTKWK